MEWPGALIVGSVAAGFIIFMAAIDLVEEYNSRPRKRTDDK